MKKLWKWLRAHFCIHDYIHQETHTIRNFKTQPPYFLATYKCSKCGKVISKYIG